MNAQLTLYATFHSASYHGNIRDVSLLIQMRKDINQIDYAGHTPIIYMASRGGHTNIAIMFIKNRL